MPTLISSQTGLAILLLAGGMGYASWARKLTSPALWVGGILGLFIYLGTGWLGLALLGLFFGLGTAASAWRVPEKRQLGIAEANKGRRRAGQVLANAGVAGIIGLIGWCHPAFAPVGGLLVAGCFSAATADTLASELGNIYGRRYYNIWTWQPDQRGLDGVISLEGTLVGASGSALLAGAYCLSTGWGPAFWWIVLAGTIGNLSDSLLGATLERRGFLTNDLVNSLNTLVGALTVAGLFAVFGSI